MNWFQKTIFSSRFWLSQNKFADTPSDLSVTVVIPAWNEEDTIAETIRSVQRQTYPCKIIVVNDRSTDRTEAIASMFYGVSVITVDEKAGSKSQALNKALPHIDTDIFICVDADTKLMPNGVDRLLRAFNNPNVMVASGFISSVTNGGFWQDARFGEYIIGQSLVKSAQENMNAVLVASGCFLAIRTPFLKQHGFDHRSMAEDLDLTWTAIEQGYDVAFVKDARCVVNDPDTWYLYRKQVYRWYAGMFQCIRMRNFDLFAGNSKLGIVVYFYMMISLTGLPMTLLILALAFAHSPAFAVVLVFMMYMLQYLPAIAHGRAIKADTRSYPRYVLASLMVGFVNYWIFVNALINELILNKTLRVWVKGH